MSFFSHSTQMVRKMALEQKHDDINLLARYKKGEYYEKVFIFVYVCHHFSAGYF